jgi:DNA-directed RNA polymerase specialized sigma24 family protein
MESGIQKGVMNTYETVVEQTRNKLLLDENRLRGVTREDVEDAFQKACLRAFEHKKFETEEGLRDYLESRTVSYVRHKRRVDAERMVALSEMTPVLKHAPNVTDGTSDFQIYVENYLVNRLSDPYDAAAVWTVLIEGTSVYEAAAILRKPASIEGRRTRLRRLSCQVFEAVGEGNPCSTRVFGSRQTGINPNVQTQS